MKIKQFQVTDAGQIFVLSEEGKIYECEFERGEETKFKILKEVIINNE